MRFFCSLVAFCLIQTIGMLNTANTAASPSHLAERLPETVSVEGLTHAITQLWGDGNIWLPTPTRWVQYEEDLGERSVVDFETGEVKVQLLIDELLSATDDLVIAHMRQGVRNLILRDGTDPFEDLPVLTATPKRGRSHSLTLDAVPSPVSSHPVILDQIRMANGSRVSESKVQYFAAEVVKKKNIKAHRIKGRDGKMRKVVTAEFNLAPDHLEIRARKYFPMVKKQALQYGLEPSLIMGIIHTESMFNPRARSHTPAYGLMQLVPSTGAADAYEKLYGKKRVISSKYLYDPENNIKLGVVYFHLLQNRYMKKIQDPESRLFCSIAAYNGGASNVGQTFIEKKSITQATRVINKMESEEVYDALVANSFSLETRKYVRKVWTRSVVYNTW